MACSGSIPNRKGSVASLASCGKFNVSQHLHHLQLLLENQLTEIQHLSGPYSGMPTQLNGAQLLFKNTYMGLYRAISKP